MPAAGVLVRAPRRPARLPLAVLWTLVAVFASGVVRRPAGRGWDLVYDIGVDAGVYLAGAAVCWSASRRLPDQRTAWRALAVALLANAAGDVLWCLLVAGRDPEPYPTAADAVYLAYYPLAYVALVGAVRARVPRFHPSMWLDGAVSALGAAALALVALHGTFLTDGEQAPAAVVTNLAYPVADVLLVVLLVATGAVLGLRVDRSLALLATGMVLLLVADVVSLQQIADDTYALGGLVDLTWLLDAAALATAARLAHPVQRARASTGVGWRVVVTPAVCGLLSVVLLAAGWSVRLPPLAAWFAVACVLGSMVRLALTFREVRALATAREQAMTDELTGLPNRRHLLALAGRALEDATPDQPLALLLLDLDGFKEINDALGHSAGDDLLRQVGPRLSGVLASGQVLGRLGGDEFAVLAPATDVGAALDLAQRVVEHLAQPFTLEGVRVHVGTSTGVATAPLPATTVAELLRCADVAMYAAKSGREGVHAYQPDADGRTGDRLRLMEDLRTALEGDELLVHLQPQVHLGDGRVAGAEALVRWAHPTRGLLQPGDLLPAAEQAGLLRPLAGAVLDLALAAAARWWTAGTQVPVSVNLSASDVADLDLASRVAAALGRHGLPPRALVLELVEDTLMKDPVRAGAVLGAVRALGVGVSIDDYGTGYSSLAYLRDLPADELKLDRAFTAGLETDPRAAAIVEHTVGLAHALGLRLVAEGVEDAATTQRLAGLGCDVAQGYHLGRPMPVDAFLSWLDRQEAAPTGRRRGTGTSTVSR